MSSHLIWAPDGKPVSVHFDPALLRKIRAVRASGFRPSETGGLLIGHARQINDRWLVAVDETVAIPARDESEESWTPDRSALDSALRKLGSKCVGWYRTHTRPGLYLDQSDFKLFRERFTGPSCVALTVSAEEAGFFFWEDGEIHRNRPYETITLEPLPESEATMAPPPPRPVWRPQKAWLAVPVIAGVALGVFWNPDPLRPRPARSTDASPVEEASNDEPRAIFSAPPLPIGEQSAGTADPYIPPPEEVPPAVQRRTSAARQAEPTRKSLLMPKPRITAAEPSMDVDLPTVAAVRLDHPAIPRRAETPVQVRLENSRPSAVRRVVGAIPMLGFLKKTKSLPENYTPPKVVKEIRPKAPVGLAEEVPVRVRVLLNSDGGIDRTELLTRKVDSSVAEAALDAAKRWRFEPARVAAKPVASEIVVQFNFPPSSGG